MTTPKVTAVKASPSHPHGIVPLSRGSVSPTLRRGPKPRIGAVAAATGVSYHNGPLIKNAEIFAFYWGSAWTNDPGLSSLSASMNGFLTAFVSGTPIDVLSEYSQPNYPIGRGLFRTPGWVVAPPLYNDPPPSVTDANLQAALPAWISGLNLDQNENSLFLMFLPPNIEVINAQGQKSCSQLCGYHGHIGGTTYYGVLPYPCIQGCTGGLNVFDALTVTTSHEICEAITDPAFTGWWDSAATGNEIGDFCGWGDNVITWGAYHIQKEWSNVHGRCVGP